MLKLRMGYQNCGWEIRMEARKRFMNISLGNKREK